MGAFRLDMEEQRRFICPLFGVETNKAAYNYSFAAAAGGHVPAGHGGGARVLRRRRPLGARCGVSGRGRRRRLGPIKVGVVLWVNAGRSSTMLRWEQSMLCGSRRAGAPGVACAA